MPPDRPQSSSKPHSTVQRRARSLGNDSSRGASAMGQRHSSVLGRAGGGPSWEHPQPWDPPSTRCFWGTRSSGAFRIPALGRSTRG